MIITKEWLKEQAACSDGTKWFIDNNQDGQEGAEIVEKLISEQKANSEALGYANWLIVRLMTRKQYLQYAVFAAEQVIHIHEKNFPTDTTARACIEAAKAVIENDTGENRNKAAAARDAARDAAWAAARDAAGDAAGDAMLTKILNYGVELIKTTKYE